MGESLCDEGFSVFAGLELDGSRGNEEKEMFKGGKLKEKEDANIDFEECLFDGECGVNGDLQVEPCDVLSSTNARFDFEDFWNVVECGSNVDLQVESCDEPNTQYHEPTPKNLRNPSSCRTIHYTELDISGVMFVDLAINREGVHLGIQLPLSTGIDYQLFLKVRRRYFCGNKDKRQCRPILLPTCELLQGFAHIYDPFERG